jgi:hypothetical protein
MRVEAIKQVALAAAVGSVLGFAHRAAVRIRRARRIGRAQSTAVVPMGGC